MLRILLIILIVAVLITVIRRMKSLVVGKDADTASLSASEMVKCSICELYVTRDSALGQGGRYFCSIEHKSRAEQESGL